MLWLKTFHIVFVASWFAGLFYLPRIFVNLAMEREPAAVLAVVGDGVQLRDVLQCDRQGDTEQDPADGVPRFPARDERADDSGEEASGV